MEGENVSMANPATCDEFLAETAKSDRDTLKFAASIGLHLSKHEEEWLTDEVLSIYCRAKPTQMERIELMKSALQWRVGRREILTSLVCPTCASDFCSHDARIFGCDCDGDPVMMNCFQLPRDLTPANLDTHMICLFERAMKEFPTPPSGHLDPLDGHVRVRKWTWVIDIYGFGVRHTDPRTTRNLITLLQTAYRGRLKKLIVLDAPTIFQGFYENVAKPFMKPRTASLVEFVAYEDAPTRFNEVFGAGMTSILLKEAEENRSVNWESKTWRTFYGGNVIPIATKRETA